MTINDFPVTVNDWDKALKNIKVTLRSPTGKTSTLTYKNSNVLFNGNPLNGNIVSSRVTSLQTGNIFELK